VITGSNSASIAIVVEQIQCSQVIQWSLSDDVELRAFEVDKSHQIIWDKDGEMLIITRQETTIPFKNINLRCFQIENFDDIKKDFMSYSEGHRFDSTYHNWIIMK
jgi:hypothetical protein